MTAHDRMPRWWAITSGEYSDYRVHAVFEDKDAAEAAVAEFVDEDTYTTYEVEPIYVYLKDDAPQWVTTHTYRGYFAGPGASEEAEEHAGEHWRKYTEPEFDTLHGIHRRAKAMVNRWYGTGASIVVHGPTREAVAKVVAEQKALLKIREDQTGSIQPTERRNQ